jgi:chemotaxis methyl-accepting protein methylase
VIKDPPFSKLDLISCRNLLIYLNVDLQKKLIPLSIPSPNFAMALEEACSDT